jgi:hypothetical protein
VPAGPRRITVRLAGASDAKPVAFSGRTVDVQL